MGYTRRQYAVRMLCVFLAFSIALHWLVGRALRSPPHHRNEERGPEPVESDSPTAVDALDSAIDSPPSTYDIASHLSIFDEKAIRTSHVQCEPSIVELGRHQSEDTSPDEDVVCCAAVLNDQDYGKTLSHLMKRLFCRKYAKAEEGTAPMRVLQVGANTGANANDHLVNFLRLGVALGVLMEPVPWLFQGLTKTYEAHRQTVFLVNGAMSPTEGNVSFIAPRQKARGWMPQMGGLQLPPKTLAKLAKKKQLRFFERIKVRSWPFESLMRTVGWDATVPDVAVVDAEGYDATIIEMILNGVESLYGKKARIPMIQYEWKHLDPQVQRALHQTLAKKGYCVLRVHYDDIATHKSISPAKGATCERSYELRRKD